MRRTLVRMLAAATAAALSASAFTITAAAQSDQQPAAAEQPTHAEQVQHWAEVGIENQLKGLKTALRLTADQEKNWDPFESAVKDASRGWVLALQKEQAGNLSPMDLNTAKADRLEQGQANLEKIVEAAKPLYTSLNGAQRQKFIALGRMLVPQRGQFAKEIRRLGKGD